MATSVHVDNIISSKFVSSGAITEICSGTNEEIRTSCLQAIYCLINMAKYDKNAEFEGLYKGLVIIKCKVC